MTFVEIKMTGVKGVTKKLTSFNNWLTTKLPQITQDEAINGSKLMVQLMPKQTGAMIQAVKVEPQQDAYAIVSRTPSRIGRRPYHVWYNAGKRGWYRYGRKRSGQYGYYQATARYLNKKYPERVMKDLKRVISSI